MSSAITEYVHYYQANYDKWGINRVNTIKSGGLEASFAQVKNQISSKSQISSLLKEAKQIEDAYNDLFFPKQSTEFSQLLSELTQETLKEQFGIAAGKINSKNLNVQSTDLSKQYREILDKVHKEIKINNLKQNATSKTILNTIRKLNKALIEFENNAKSDILKIKTTQAKQELKRIKQRIKKQTNLKKIDFSDDIVTLNRLIQEFDRSFQWYNQRGDLFEWLLPLIQLQGTELTGEQLRKNMKSLIGSNNLGSSFTSFELPDFMNIKKIKTSDGIETEKINIKIVNIRNKIDLIINFATGNGQYKKLNISAKSVSGQQIKLVQGTNLYYVLVFSQNYDFIKHYLNIISWSKEGGKAPMSQIKKANRLVSSLIMQLAAQGYDLNNPSDLIIMHNVKEGVIKVYNIKVLMDMIKEKLLSGKDSRYKNLIKSDFNQKFTIKQPFEDTVQKRLNYLFDQINKQKITAFLYRTQLEDYAKLLNSNNII